MAQQVKGFTRIIRNYDWDRWMNGKVWRIRKGDDYTVSTRSMRSLLYARARKSGKMVTTSMPSPEALEFQFFKGEQATKGKRP